MSVVVEKPKKRMIRRTDHSFNFTEDSQLSSDPRDVMNSNKKIKKRSRIPTERHECGSSSDEIASVPIVRKRSTRRKKTNTSKSETHQVPLIDTSEMPKNETRTQNSKFSSKKRRSKSVSYNVSDKENLGVSFTMNSEVDTPPEQQAIRKSTRFSKGSLLQFQTDSAICDGIDVSDNINKRFSKVSIKVPEIDQSVMNDANGSNVQNFQRRSTFALNAAHELTEQNSPLPLNKPRKSRRKRWSDDLKNDSKEIANRFDFLKSLEGYSPSGDSNLKSQSSLTDGAPPIIEECSPAISGVQDCGNSEDILDTSKTRSRTRGSKSFNSRRSKSVVHSSVLYNIDHEENPTSEQKNTSIKTRYSRGSIKTPEIDQSVRNDTNGKQVQHFMRRTTLASNAQELPEQNSPLPLLNPRKSRRKRWSDDLKNDPNGIANRFDFLKSLEGNSSEVDLDNKTWSAITDETPPIIEERSPAMSEVHSGSGNSEDILDTSKTRSSTRGSKLSNSKRRSKSLVNSSVLYNIDHEENPSSEQQTISIKTRSWRVSIKAPENNQPVSNDTNGTKVQNLKRRITLASNTYELPEQNSPLPTIKPKRSGRKRWSDNLKNYPKGMANSLDFVKSSKGNSLRGDLNEKTRSLNTDETSPVIEERSPAISGVQNSGNSEDILDTSKTRSRTRGSKSFNSRRTKSVVNSPVLYNIDHEENPTCLDGNSSSGDFNKKTLTDEIAKSSNQQWRESEIETSDDCIIIDDETLNASSEKDENKSLTLLNNKRRSRSLTSVIPSTPANLKEMSPLHDQNEDSSFETSKNSRIVNFRHRSTPHPVHKRRRTYELEESVTDASVLKALSESISPQPAVTIAPNNPSCIKKVRFEHVTFRKTQKNNTTSEINQNAKSTVSLSNTSVPKYGNSKKSGSFDYTFLPSTSSTPYGVKKFNLAKEMMTRKAKINAQQVKRRSRSAEDCVSRTNRTVMPDFAKLHKKAADKMESIIEMKERKAERAKLLLSGQRPTNVSNQETNKKSHRQLVFNVPSVSTVTVKQNETKMIKKKTVAEAGHKKLEPPQTSRFGFKVSTSTTKDRNVEIKAIGNKTKPPKDTREEKRTVLKGVRGNRRFDLLMKMRQK